MREAHSRGEEENNRRRSGASVPHPIRKDPGKKWKVRNSRAYGRGQAPSWQTVGCGSTLDPMDQGGALTPKKNGWL